MFAASSVFPREEPPYIIKLFWRHLLFLGADVSYKYGVWVFAVKSNNVSCINDLTLSSIQYVVVKFETKSIGSQRTETCSKDRFLSGAYGDFTCVDCEAYTVYNNRRFPVLIT